jgi:peroxiredoxin/DNA-binding transcriptional MerR regulator
MKISELADSAGVTAKAVRYYETLGLVIPKRLGNGYRDYAESDVRVVREIKSLSELGIPVDRTRPFLECLAGGQEHIDDCPAALAGYRDAIAELNQRIDGLITRRDALIRVLNEAADRQVRVARDEGRDAIPDDYLDLPADLPVPEDDGAANHLLGMPMPALALDSTAGESIRLDTLGEGRTILYLYPLTGRPGIDLPVGWNSIPGARGCTPEACDFRDHHQMLLDAGAGRVFGLSSQATDYQREVVDRLRLPFAMLSDPKLRLAQALRLPTFEVERARLYKRLTMIVRSGVIEHVFYPIFPPNEHAHHVLTWLNANRAG